MKFRILYFIAFPVLLLTACSDEDNDAKNREHEERVMDDYITTYYPTATPTASGLYYIPKGEGTGIAPSNPDDFVILDYSEFLVETFRLYDTSNKKLATQEGITRSTLLKFEGPLKISLREIQNSIPGLYEGLMMMQEGDSARLIMSSTLALTSYVPVYFDVKLLKVIPNPKTFEREQLSQFLINTYSLTIADSTNTDSIGIYFISTLEGTGEYPNIDSTVTCKYTFKLMPYSDGNYLNVPFRTIELNNSLSFKIKQNAVIAGFEAAVKRIKTGGKATVIIPYYWGYGSFRNPETGQISLPAYSTLIYDIEVTDN